MGWLEPAGASVARSCYIVHLPVEILTSIIRVDVDTPKRLEELATVCHQWRNAILTYGPLWSNIYVGSRTTKRQLSTQLARSTNARLSVELYYNHDPASPSGEKAEIARMILNERKRVREFRLTTSVPWGVPHDTAPALDIVQAFGSGARWPILESLGFCGCSATLPKFDLHPVAPNLRRLSLSYIKVQDWSFLRMWTSSIQSLTVLSCNIDDIFFRELFQFAVLTELDLHAFLDDDAFAVMLQNHGSLSSLRSLTFGVAYMSFETFLTLLSCVPELTSLCVTTNGTRHPDLASSVDVTLPHLEKLELCFRYDLHDDILGHLFRDCRPPRLASVRLEHIALCRFDIVAGPALLYLQLDKCIVDADELAAALQRCPNLEVLRLAEVLLSGGMTTCLAASDAEILARLRTSDVSFRVDDHPEEEASQPTLSSARIQRFLSFVITLLPPTCSSSICGKGVSRLRQSQILNFIPRDGAIWHSVQLRIGFLRPEYVFMRSVDGNVQRRFDADSISGCINLMHSHFGIFARVSLLHVGSEAAVHLFSLKGIAFPILQGISIKFRSPSRLDQYFDETKLYVDGLRAVIASAPVVPMESPLLRVIQLDLDIAHRKPVLPIALKGTLLGMFRSEVLVKVILPHGVTWTKE